MSLGDADDCCMYLFLISVVFWLLFWPLCCHRPPASWINMFLTWFLRPWLTMNPTPTPHNPNSPNVIQRCYWLLCVFFLISVVFWWLFRPSRCHRPLASWINMFLTWFLRPWPTTNLTPTPHNPNSPNVIQCCCWLLCVFFYFCCVLMAFSAIALPLATGLMN